MSFQEQRMDTVLPILHTNHESRRTTFEHYSFVPLSDFIVRPAPGSLGPILNFDFAINWREDTVFWNKFCPLPPPDRPWANHLCNATKLCIPLGDNSTSNMDWEIAPSLETNERIQAWNRSILPILSKLKDITFAITAIEEYMPMFGASLPQWSEVPFTPIPHFSLLGSDIDGGPLKLNKYPLKTSKGPLAEGEKPYWWEPLLNDGLDWAKRFQLEINRERPGMKFNLALDTNIIEYWNMNVSENRIRQVCQN
ncbi:hypothetical protein F5Y12DRAFT_770287 [Xylaria sp. FL1777]|nr:hypothetical protein F5Y12DRAFT_770287 [Xylaria sp. FL1777]